MILATLDRLSEQAAERYRLLHVALVGEEFRQLTQGDVNLVALTRAMGRLLAHYGQTERGFVEAAALKVHQSASREVERRGALSIDFRNALKDYAITSSDALYASLLQQAQRDAAQLNLQLRRLLIASGAASMRGVSQAKAVLNAAINTRQADFIDRAGRRWDATRYVRTVTRGALINLYVDTLMSAAEYFGQSHLYTDQGEALPLTEMIRERFHPNSSTLPQLISRN
jgi:hypothetical protein